MRWYSICWGQVLLPPIASPAPPAFVCRWSQKIDALDPNPSWPSLPRPHPLPSHRPSRGERNHPIGEVSPQGVEARVGDTTLHVRRYGLDAERRVHHIENPHSRQIQGSRTAIRRSPPPPHPPSQGPPSLGVMTLPAEPPFVGSIPNAQRRDMGRD